MLVVWCCQEASPLRRRLSCGGCSWVEYQQIAAVVLSCPFLVRTLLWWWFWNGGRGDVVVFVFGTLLGPEATGPGFWPRVCLFLVFLAMTVCTLLGVWGVWFGVVV